MDELDVNRFKKILIIYFSIAESTMAQTNHISVLLTKVLSRANKIEYLF